VAGESSVLHGEISALSLTNRVLCGDLKDMSQESSKILIVVGELSAGESRSRCSPGALRSAPGSLGLPGC